MERTAGLSKHLLGINVEQEGLNWDGWVPLLVNIQGEVLDVGQHYCAIPIIKVENDILDRMIAKAALADAKGGLVRIGDSSIKSFLDDAVDDLMVRPHNEVGRMLGLEDGAVVVI